MEASPDPVNQESAPEPEAVGDDAPISADPVTEIRTLRAKTRILRAERMAIAGRKYVLETVVETLRQKLDELARAFAMIEAGGDIAEAVKTVGGLVSDARRIAEDKVALEGELEVERAERLQERRSREAREFELEERAAGLAAERSVRVERMADLEARVKEHQAAGEGADDVRRQLATATAELHTAATELERAANDAEARARELAEVRQAHESALHAKDALEAELATVRGSTEAVHQAKAEHIALGEQLQLELDHARAERDALNRALISAQADHARALEQALDDNSKSNDNDRKLREDMAATLEAERAQMRQALDAAEGVKQVLEAEKEELAKRLDAQEIHSTANGKDLADAQAQLKEQKPVLDALADRVEDLEKEVNKLATRLGEARDRGKVDVKELLIRAALLKRRAEREAADAASGKQKPLTRALKASGANPPVAPAAPSRTAPSGGSPRPPSTPSGRSTAAKPVR